MARKVDDLIYLLEIMQGPDNIDPQARPVPWLDPYAVDVSRLRIGFHTDNGIKTPDKDIIDTVVRVVDLLKTEGFTASEVRPTGIEMAGLIFSRVFGADNGEMIEALLEDCRTETPSNKVQESLASRGPALSGREFAQVINLWHNYQSSMLSYFDDFDILLSPTNAHTAIRLGSKEDLEAYTYTSAYNLTGWPGVVIRAGTDESGLPIGLQILSSPFREDRCLALAAWLENNLGSFPAPGISAQNTQSAQSPPE